MAHLQPHICLSKEHMHPVVIVVGDPKRAAILAKMCQDHRELANNREYRSFECTHDDQKFIVISHGVGAPGAAICFEELIKIGAKVIFRAGTAGSLQPQKIKQGDIVIVHSASRDDGVTGRYVPNGFSAVADFDLTHRLLTHARNTNLQIHLGQTLTSDIFYESLVLEPRLQAYAKAQVDIVDMETSTLFTIAKVRQIKSTALCSIDGCPFAWDEGNYDPHGQKLADAKTKMLNIAISAAADFTKNKIWE